MRFVESEAQRNGNHSEEGRSERLFEPFFNARAEATALAEQLGTARQQHRLQRKKYRLAREGFLGRWRAWFGR